MRRTWITALVVLSLAAQSDLVHVRVGYTTSASTFNPGIIGLALNRTQSEGRLLERNFSLSYRLPGCSALDGVAAEVELIQDEQVDVILGQICSIACIPSGYYDTYYNIARIPMSCADPVLQDKNTYPTLMRCMSSSDKVGRAIEQVFLKYGWKRTALMTRESGLCEFGIRDAKRRFENINVTVTDIRELDTSGSAVTDIEIRQNLLKMKERARVMIICHMGSVVRRIMFQAQELGLTAPEYVFLYYQMLPGDFTEKPWQEDNTNFTEAETQKRKAAFTSLKQVSLVGIDDDTRERFVTEVSIQAASMDQWTMQPAPFGDWNQNVYTMFLVDCSYMYFMIVHEMLEAGLDFRNGSAVRQMARNREFHGWTGRVVLNDNADRDPDFWVWDCPADEPTCRPYSYVSISPPDMADFRAPYWGTSDRAHPPDTPACGFHGELCLPDNNSTTKIIGSVAAIVCAGALLFGIFFYKRQEYREKQLHLMTWKVKFEDIEFSSKLIDGGASLRSMRSMVSMDKSHGSFSGISGGNEQLFARVGELGGVIVAVKHIDKPTVNVTRDILVELKTLKDLVHENINAFVGACIVSPNISILTKYCSKGSLQDVIENDDIKLDWIFKSSLLRDLINGMCYVGNTPRGTHGNLRSSNCMIDSRWVMKISGFTLTKFCEGKSHKDESEWKKHQKLLWTAPELLRMSERERPPYGTDKGDVYSFAIILQEIVYRTTPFFELNPQEIVERVRSVNTPPFRPSPPTDPESAVRPDLLSMMERCWSEQPTDRPTFDHIHTLFKAVNRGTNTNIMDNMIRMMEKYASNLEGLVQQRTGELLEEKKKTDILLYRMLPPIVAEQLKVGKSIHPEMYENVTIYFSDIVGFTSLSSSSTPMEVVDLLNDLYTIFDATIEMYDVYKVETIGDAYMVVSGVPRRNGTNHAPEIADMALSLLKQVLTFKIRHRPDLTLNLRIGLHTGSCAAGVVGRTMPRFCLFDDTVNMASRMESTGEAQKIHISKATQQALLLKPQYQIVERGDVDVKGKGTLITYWLQDKRES